jgi:hypothetical protein
MNEISKRKQVFLIGFVIIWALYHLACGPPLRDEKPVKAKKKPVPVTKSKKTQKVEKPAPVFQPQATITTADGKVYEVADFGFFSNHRSFSGGYYYPKSGTIKWPLYLKQGPTWKKIDFAKVKSMTFSKSKSYKWLQIHVVFIDGNTLQGLHPFKAFGYLWVKQGSINLTGKSEVLGKTGPFKCTIGNIFSIDRLDPGEGPAKFKITHDKKEKKETIITEPQFKRIWKKTTPKYLDIYRLKSNMPITVNNTEIKIKPEEIESIIMPEKSSELPTVKMKTGETVKFELPPRVFGKLENGDILFTYLFEKGKPVVKELQIK